MYDSVESYASPLECEIIRYTQTEMEEEEEEEGTVTWNLKVQYIWQMQILALTKAWNTVQLANATYGPRQPF